MSFKSRLASRTTISAQSLVSRANGVAFVLAFVCSLAVAHPARCQDWPARPVTIVVPFPPGGNTDSMARILAQKLGEKFGRNFIVENRPGASGSIAMADVKRATPDGYTLALELFSRFLSCLRPRRSTTIPKRTFHT